MAIKDLLLLTLGCILSSNYLLLHFFGGESLLENKENSVKGNLTFSLYLLIVLLISSLLIWPLEKYVISNGGEYLRVFVYLFAIVLVVALLTLIFKRKLSDFVSVGFSSAILGSLLYYNSLSYSLLEIIFASFGVAIGYFIVAMAIVAVKERIRDKNIPSPFRGLPILIVALGLISLTVYAF